MGLHKIWRPDEGTLVPYRARIYGSFDCNGSSDPADVQGDIRTLFDVTRSAAGTYLLTWKNGDRPPKIVNVTPSFLGDVTPGDQVVAEAAVDAATTITIKTFDGVGDTDIPSGENIRVQVAIVVNLKKLD